MKSSSSSISKSHNRCHHLSPSGRRCSQPACSSHPTLCFAHKPVEATEDKLLLQELSQVAASLDSPEDVSRVLGKIFRALLEDRISIKKAGTLGFLGQMLIRSHREIEYYKKTHRQNEEESAAVERHRLFLQQQDERRARIEARDAEQRRIEAEQAAQVAREAAKKRAAASKPVAQASACARSDNSDAASKEHGTSAAAFCSNEASTMSEGDCSKHPVVPPSNESKPTIVPTALNASPQSPKTTPPPQPDLNHFYPIDPTLPAGRQDRSKNFPPPDAEELRWRELSRQYARGRGRR